MEVVDVSFDAMGGYARIVAVGGSYELVGVARARLAQLESRWSRFLPTSEVSQCNAAGGRPVVVSDDTYLLVERACEGWRLTAGVFDPTVFDAITRLGYTNTFATVGANGSPAPSTPPRCSPGCAGIELDPIVRAVRLPASVRFDPGGIGKGLAADIVASDLLAAGARGALVSVGGDLRVAGEPPGEASEWRIAVEDPDDPNVSVATLEIGDGGVATTSRRSRTWRCGNTIVHHVLDPRTGEPAPGPRSVTAVAPATWLAEVYAKAAFVAASDAVSTLRSAGLQGIVIGEQDAVEVAA